MALSALTFLGFGSRKTKAEGDPPEDKKTKAAEDDEDKKQAAVDPDDDDEDDDDDDEDREAAVRSATFAERQRIAGIVTAGGADKVEAALQVALNTDLSVEEASKLLGALPATAKSSPLAAAMEGRTPKVGIAGAPDGGAGKPGALAANMQRLVDAQLGRRA